MKYITYFYVSTNYEQNNYVEWQNTFNIIAAKIFNIGLFCRMVYNEPQATPRNRSLQWTYKIVQKQVASGTGIAHGPDKKLSLKRHVQKQ